MRNVRYSNFLADININLFNQEGEFWRILLPGIYTMEVFAEGFAPREVQFAIVEQNPTMLNITLYKVSKETFEKLFKSSIQLFSRMSREETGIQWMSQRRSLPAFFPLIPWRVCQIWYQSFHSSVE